jgi:glycosyltransferase involved in cell wall biosynthesis
MKINNQQQILLNNLICFCINLIYLTIEPFRLFLARRKVKLKESKYINISSEKVSIVIPTYNRADILINRTIPSVLSQTHKNIELIIVGDNCIDDTPEKIKKITDERVKFINLNKRGRYPKKINQRWFVQGSKPRNHGMLLATGKWLVFISDDDILYDFHVETLLKNAIQRNLEFISAGYKTIKNGVELTVLPGKNNIGSELVCGGMQTWLYRSYLKSFKWNMHAWRKKYDKPVDYDLQQRLFRSGVRMGHINDVVYFNPAVEGTNTTGYVAAIQAEKEE